MVPGVLQTIVSSERIYALKEFSHFTSGTADSLQFARVAIAGKGRAGRTAVLALEGLPPLPGTLLLKLFEKDILNVPDKRQY